MRKRSSSSSRVRRKSRSKQGTRKYRNRNRKSRSMKRKNRRRKSNGLTLKRKFKGGTGPRTNSKPLLPPDPPPFSGKTSITMSGKTIEARQANNVKKERNRLSVKWKEGKKSAYGYRAVRGIKEFDEWKEREREIEKNEREIEKNEREIEKNKHRENLKKMQQKLQAKRRAKDPNVYLKQSIDNLDNKEE